MVTALPTGVVSFLFTDVEGSTRLWETDSEGMAGSLALHDEIMRAAISEHGGHVFSTAGDAFAVAFQTCDEAVEAARDIQLRLISADWPGPEMRVRMGIHTGSAEERDGDYFGPTLNRAARIMSAGHGRQVLLSSVSAQTVDGQALGDLGTHHLKDLEDPEHVFELRHEGLPSVDTPIRTVDVRRHNLPDYLTSFVGRAAQLGELADALADERLVVLTGVGGTGKTRLAVEAARRLATDQPDGAWLVELAPVTNPAFIMSTIGDAWGLRPGEGATIEDVVTRYLWSRDLLLIVDNCEHLLDAAAETIKFLLDSCPDLRIVATSRESLGIPGEAILRVPSLGLADPDHILADSEAVQLFLDRAQAVQPGFDPSDDEMVDIGRICTRIDGIPLGLELAAARLRSMSPSELASRLGDSFRILSGSAKTSLPRQRTLHATIDWSYDLLKPAEQAMFRRLSLFTGGFDLAAAEAVCAGDEVEDWEVLDHLDSLVDKSLIVPAVVVDGGTRYRLLEPVRQYAQERLGETTEPIRYRRAHAEYFLGLATESSPRLRGPDQMELTEQMDLDFENMRSAFATFLETDDIDSYLDLLFQLQVYWVHKGRQMEGIGTGLAGLEATDDHTDQLKVVKGWYIVGRFGAELTRPSGIDHARAGLEVAKELGDPNAIGRMEMALGTCIRHATTDPEYLEHLLEGRRLLDEHPEPHWWDPNWERGLHNLLFAAYLPHDDDRIFEHLETALQVFEESGDRVLLAATLADSASVYGEVDRQMDEWALANSKRARDILAELDSPNFYGHALYYYGILLRYEGKLREAMDNLALGAARLDDVGDSNCWAGATRALARCEAALGVPEPAAGRLVATISRLPVLPMQEIHKPRTTDAAAEVFLAAGDLEKAGIALGVSLAAELPTEYRRIRDSELDEVRQALVEVVGKEAATRYIDQGRALEIDEAIAQIEGWLDA